MDSALISAWGALIAVMAGLQLAVHYLDMSGTEKSMRMRLSSVLCCAVSFIRNSHTEPALPGS